MAGHRPRRSTLLAAACALLASLPAISARAQVAPPGQYTPPGPYAPPGQYKPPGPYAPSAPYSVPGQYTPPPNAQPVPYPGQTSTPGYMPLRGNNEDITSDAAHSWLILRASGGAGLIWLPKLPIKPSFVLDTTLGFRWALAPRVSIAFEGAYSYDSEPHYGGMFGALGAGPELYVTRYLSVGYSPKLVLGATWGGFAIGVRNTLAVGLLMHVLNIEIGHQYVRSAGLDQNELRAQLGFDVAGLAQLLIVRALAR